MNSTGVFGVVVVVVVAAKLRTFRKSCLKTLQGGIIHQTSFVFACSNHPVHICMLQSLKRTLFLDGWLTFFNSFLMYPAFENLQQKVKNPKLAMEAHIEL